MTTLPNHCKVLMSITKSKQKYSGKFNENPYTPHRPAGISLAEKAIGCDHEEACVCLLPLSARVDTNRGLWQQWSDHRCGVMVCCNLDYTFMVVGFVLSHILS